MDETALPKPQVRGKNYIAPRNDIEKRMQQIWMEILDIDDEISVDSDYWALGGNSLKAGQLAGMLRQEFAIALAVTTLFNNRRMDEMSSVVAAAQAGVSLSPLPPSSPSPQHTVFA